jgi:hypothetical protein
MVVGYDDPRGASLMIRYLLHCCVSPYFVRFGAIRSSFLSSTG